MRKLFKIILCFLSASVFAQESSLTKTPILTAAQEENVLDNDMILSARGAAMSGALSTLADGIHAPYYNPAGIGGLHWGSNKPPLLRQFHFPYLGASANTNSTVLNKDFTHAGGANERAIGKRVLDANAGKRQFVRSSEIFDMVFGRTTALIFNDTQFAAFKKTGTTASEGSISASYQNQSGGGVGFSACDPKETFYIGAFTSMVQRSIFSGDFTYDQVANITNRAKLFTDGSYDYHGVATTLGALWVFSKNGNPALAVVSHNIGNSHYNLIGSPKTASSNTTKKLIIDHQDLTIGFSVSPQVGKKGFFNFILEAARLTDQEVAMTKKMRGAFEWNIGGFGSDGVFSLRSGFSDAGGSGGFGFNFGLLQIEAASQAVDVGTGNKRMIERRNIAVVGINVLDN